MKSDEFDKLFEASMDLDHDDKAPPGFAKRVTIHISDMDKKRIKPSYRLPLSWLLILWLIAVGSVFYGLMLTFQNHSSDFIVPAIKLSMNPISQIVMFNCLLILIVWFVSIALGAYWLVKTDD